MGVLGRKKLSKRKKKIARMMLDIVIMKGFVFMKDLALVSGGDRSMVISIIDESPGIYIGQYFLGDYIVSRDELSSKKIDLIRAQFAKNKLLYSVDLKACWIFERMSGYLTINQLTKQINEEFGTKYHRIHINKQLKKSKLIKHIGEGYYGLNYIRSEKLCVDWSQI